jgi:hypothetical protein
MSRGFRCGRLVLAGWLLLLGLTAAADAQGRAGSRHPIHPVRPTVVTGHVFIGGYYYDPVYGPYPWWPRGLYPYWYVPVYDYRADVRIKVLPDSLDDAAVYVDGFYAGIVNEFDGVLQSLPLAPGGHTIVLYREGYRTVRHNIYLSPGSTYQIRDTLEPVPVGVRSEPPELSPAVPPPPTGTYRTPATPPKSVAPPTAATATPEGRVGSVDLFVQPPDAEVIIDGQTWVSSERGHLVVQLPAGRHRIEVRRPGYRPFAREIDVREGESKPLNVMLSTSS